MGIDPVTAAIGGSVVSGVMGSSASKKAAKASSRAADQQVQLYRDIYEDTSKKFKPYLDAGNSSLAAYMYEMGLGEAPKDYGGFTTTPGYDFRLQSGNDSINALAGARGGLHSGATLKALADYNQGMASDEYGNYLGRLAGLTDMGTGAAANTASAGANYAAGAGNALAQSGQAQANSYLNSANAMTGGINNALGIWRYQSQLGT